MLQFEHPYEKYVNKEPQFSQKKTQNGIRDLNINLKMIKLLEDNIREMIGTVGFRYTPKEWTI